MTPAPTQGAVQRDHVPTLSTSSLPSPSAPQIPGPALSPPWGFPKAKAPQPLLPSLSMEESQLFPLLGSCHGVGGSQHKNSVTPTPHPGWPQQHPEALPALGATGTGLSTTGRITAGFARQKKGAPSVPLSTHPTGLHTGRHQTGTHHVWACSVPPSHPATVPAGLKGAGTRGWHAPNLGERRETP